MYDGLYEASGSDAATGTIGWIPTWSDGMLASIQCDFICMVSPAIKDIDAIQWVSGAGQKPMWQWLDVLKKCQQAGKALQIFDLNCEQAKQVHRELGPTGIVYCVQANTAAEVEDLTRWLERNS